MAQHQSLLEFKSGRYLKVALFVCAAAIGAYWYYGVHTASIAPYGGTWLGYTLGTIAAVLILWLMLLGIRKRRYRSRLGSVQGWASAHVYLGTSLIIIATLHCAFEFGWNIHTLAYALMMLVIVSGFFGVYAYLRYPGGHDGQSGRRDARDDAAEGRRPGDQVQAHRARPARRGQCAVLNAIQARSRENGPARQPAAPAGRRGHRAPDAGGARPAAQDGHAQLFAGSRRRSRSSSSSRCRASWRSRTAIRRDLQIRALMQVWLYFHVPLSFALLAALIAHVVSVFYFW